MADPSGCNVADQRADPGSVLHFVRAVVALRRRVPDLVSGRYEALDAPDGVWAWRRGAASAVVLNLSAASAEMASPAGAWRVALSTDPARRAQDAEAGVRLGPWEGIVMAGGR